MQRRLCAALLASTALAAALLLPAAGPARAQDATWLASPGTADFNTGTNWSPATVPTGTAFFGASNTTNLSFSNDTMVGGWTFNVGASAYSFTDNGFLTFLGTGIVVNGGSAIISTTNTGVVTFYNTSTAGSATINSGGSVSFVDTSTAGSATVNNTSFLTFFQASTAANATINNSGVLTFYNTSTAGTANVTNNSGGNLGFYNASTAGSATITNNNGSSLNFNDTSTAGSAAITNNAGGTLNFNATSTAGSATITNNSGGFVSFNGTSSAGGATITNDSGAEVDFNAASTAGSAGITNNFLGVLNFNGTSSASSATISNNGGGTLNFFNSSTAGSAAIINNAGVTFVDTSTAGSATITNNLGRTLYFENASTAGSATIANSGDLAFLDGSTAGSAAITNNSSGVVDFSSSTGPALDHKIAAGSIAGTGNYKLGANELTVGSNNLSTTVSGVIADGGAGGGTGGSLVKTGTGTLTLSGINTYTGATEVNGGTLAVNGSITASGGVTVNSGGTLGGTGTVGNTTILSGGALAPGNSIGTLNVSGNLTFNAASFYTVEVSPSAADRTNVTGIATLTGATVQAVALPGSFRAQTYTILTAAGGLGGTQFAGITGSSFSPARNPHLTYDANDVYLVLDPGTLQLPAGASGNQTNVAGAINNFVENGGTPPAGFDVLLNMSGSQLGNALTQISGQPGASGTQSSFNAMQQFVSMLDPASGHGGGLGGVISYAEEDEALGYASASKRDAQAHDAYAAVTPRDRRHDSFEGRWGVWASGYGGASTVSGSATTGTSTTTSRVYGTVAGADYRVSPDTLIGFAFGGAGFNFSLSDGLGGGRADLFQAGLYGRHSFGAAYLSASLAYGWQDVTTDRTVTVSGTDKLTANYKASTFAARTEVGWRFAPWPAAGLGATPYAALQVTSFHLPGYSETATSGSSTFALSYNAQTTTNVRSELGARLDKLFVRDDGLFTLRGRLAWAHDSNTDRPVTAAFQNLPGSTFMVNGAQPAANAALVSASAEMKWRNGFSLAATFEGEFSSTTQSYAGKGIVRYAW